MREIKFRAWDIELKKIAHIAGLKYDRDLKLSKATCAYQITEGEIYGGDSTEPWDVELLYRGIEFLILMQFTGLHDSKGNEIYEGDVVKTVLMGDEIIGTVKYGEKLGCFYLAVTNKHGVQVALDSVCCTLMTWLAEDIVAEVIGNIYENPEMLKEPYAYNQD